MPLLHHQPFKGVYLVYRLAKLCWIDIPFWTLSNLIPSWRAVPTHTLYRTVCMNLIRWATEVFFRVDGLPRRDVTLAATARELRGTGASFVWIPPYEEEVKGQVGTWVKETGTQAVRIPGYWIGQIDLSEDPAVRRSKEEKILIHFHGGSYITGTALPTEPMAYMPVQLCQMTSTLKCALLVEYRLTGSSPNGALHPFPAALIDALSSYQYVTSLGFQPSNVIISGDSAGGNLALAITRYLVDAQEAKLRALLLFSPWCDLTDSHHVLGSSYDVNYPRDYLLGARPAIGDYAIRCFTAGVPPTNPYISPACLRLVPEPSFEGFPRTYIVSGEAELIRDEIRTLKDRMERGMADGVVYDEVENAPHDLCAMWFMEPERTEALKRVALWIDKPPN